MDRAQPTVERRPDEVVLAFSGTLDAARAGRIWARTLGEAVRARGRRLVLDLREVASCDTAGAALLLAAERAHGGETAFRNLAEPADALLARIRPWTAPTAILRRRAVTVRQVASGFAGRIGDGVAFLGETVVATVAAPARRRMLRLAEIGRHADQAGVRAVPLVLLLGVLMGLILSFQSLLPLRRFGADIYVANLVGISLTRELGPLLAAVILAGRTGSAFAAEIGTMRVNEEIDALRTLDLDPVTMLVLPRLIAASIVMPALTVLLEIAGFIGMMLVLNGFGYPPAAVANQVAVAVKTRDLWGGLFKAVVFGCVIAAIGCRAGLATGIGPRAVGNAATSAVVGGIVATILLDGAFALLFYRIGV